MAAEPRIRNALLKAAEDAANDLDLVIIMPNPGDDDAQPPAPAEEAKWLRAHVLRVPPGDIGIQDDAATEFMGILQIDCMMMAGTGDKNITDLAGSVAAYFERGVLIDLGEGEQFRLNRTPSISGLMEDDPWVKLAISVRYEAYV